MPKRNDMKSAIREARKLIEDVQKLDGNEAETRCRVERMFESVMGYDAFKHLSREYAVYGVGDTEHMDFAIKLSHGEVSMVVELKRVNVDLSKKHLKEAMRYAIDIGCEWVLLTNGREWDLYHIEFGQPPEILLIKSWNLLRDDLSILAEGFELVSFSSLKKGVLNCLWEKQRALTPQRLLSQLLAEDSIRHFKNAIRKETGVSVHPEDIVSAIRKLLNDSAGTLMDQVKISLPERKPGRGRGKQSAGSKPEDTAQTQEDSVG